MIDGKNPEDEPSQAETETAPEGEESTKVADPGEEVVVSSDDVADVGDVLGDPIAEPGDESEALDPPVEADPEPETAGDPVDTPDTPDIPDVSETPPEEPDVSETPDVPPDIAADADVAANTPDTPDVPDVPDVPAVAAPVIDKARRRATVVSDKKIADAKRHDVDIAEAAAAAPEPSKEVTADDDRRAGIADRMYALDEQAAALEQEALKIREEGAALQLELYPQQGPNDVHSKAVRGYLDASARERAHRAASPARLKAMLRAAGMAPIDAAFSRQRARGAGWPKHPVKAQTPAAAQDQSPAGTPGDAPAAQE